MSDMFFIAVIVASIAACNMVTDSGTNTFDYRIAKLQQGCPE